MTNGAPQSRYVKADVSEARVARLWAQVSSRIESAPRRAPSWRKHGAIAALVAGVALASGSYVVNERRAHSVWPAAALETASDAMTVALDDGSRVELAAATKVRMSGNEPLSLSLALEHGRVDCDITPHAGRHFTVSAAGVEVRVKGTRFGVELAPGRDRVEVDVSRGLVEVSWQNGAVRRDLAAGERWSIDLAHPDPTATPARAGPQKGTGASTDTTNTAATAPAASATPGPASVEASAATAHVSPPHVSAPPSARELLDLGNAARRAGDITGATRAYEELVSTHPTDARAGLAAFELGRLRMDRLGDVQGAISALQKAVALAPGAGFREDAMARLVEAYAAAGALERCRSAQAAYLKSYPGGVHGTAVSRQCRAK